MKLLEKWMKSYKPEELFDGSGRLRSELAALAPEGQRRMGANPRSNGGALLRDLRLPDFRDYAVEVTRPGVVEAEATRRQGEYLRDVMRLNADARNFRVFSPDETSSNRWNAVFEASDRCSTAETSPLDENVSPDGRVMEILSEHMCQGWLEGYLLTGRHGFFSCYEAFVHIVDSMFNQHAKWLKSSKHIPWRRPIASLNYLLTSHVWRQDHNGFSHQDPGFIDHVVNKKADIIRVYLPPDANTLLSVTDHCLRSRMGLLEPTEGQILVDGQSILGEQRRSWQRAIAHVPQSIFLADSTIAENIAFGVPRNEIDMNLVRKAARQAQIDKFIESCRKAYNELVGERGIRLSGGQRQRIGIARALYKQASVLIFDEATSSLDNATEQAVMESIESLNRDLTILIIAHRLTTVKRCDQIIELAHGKVVAQGSYEQLLEQSHSFRSMAQYMA